MPSIMKGVPAVGKGTAPDTSQTPPIIEMPKPPAPVPGQTPPIIAGINALPQEGGGMGTGSVPTYTGGTGVSDVPAQQPGISAWRQAAMGGLQAVQQGAGGQQRQGMTPPQWMPMETPPIIQPNTNLAQKQIPPYKRRGY